MQLSHVKTTLWTLDQEFWIAHLPSFRMEKMHISCLLADHNQHHLSNTQLPISCLSLHFDLPRTVLGTVTYPHSRYVWVNVCSLSGSVGYVSSFPGGYFFISRYRIWGSWRSENQHQSYQNNYSHYKMGPYTHQVLSSSQHHWISTPKNNKKSFQNRQKKNAENPPIMASPGYKTRTL